MILQRITHAIRNQNWIAVALEFMVVVAGVVIGFGVTGWNAARQDRADEADVLARLHDDIELAESLSQRVRERRLERIGDIIGAIDILFGRRDDETFSMAQCSSFASSHYFDINTAGLAAFTELAGAGRIGIIRDPQLRRDLVQYEQVRHSLRELISGLSNTGNALPQLYPDLITLDARYDEPSGEVRTISTCNLEGMRASQSFINAASENADAYDAYIRDGLRPWSDQLSQLHDRIDRILNITHAEEAAE